jgi:predicted alpha/beta-hydrolase family hydrolase
MKPFFLFAPGAGAPSSHPWMQRWKNYLSTLGDVDTFDYSYIREMRKRPDPLPGLIQTHRQALAETRAKTSAPIILIGKSMGGRVGCHVVLEEKVNGVVCLGYPLCGGGDHSKLRDRVLLALRTPILFVQGTRDPLCPLDLLEGVRAKMTAPTFLHIVEGGDHSLLVSKSQAKRESQDEIDGRTINAIAEFVARIT